MAQAKAQVQAHGESFLSPSQKREIASYVRDIASLYSYCYDVAVEKLGEKINDPTAIKDVATTLFLSAAKRYNLQ
jgi:hypothetical protein